jgi:ABC-type multidrug transport system fused ATPase/permease subunit
LDLILYAAAALCAAAATQVLADKTVVLATNQLQFVSMADVVVVMRAGAAVEVGSYSELLNAGGLFTALMKEAQVS